MENILIFVDHEVDIPAVVEFCRENPRTRLIALNTMVMWELEKKNLEYSIPADHFDAHELRLLRENLYERTEQICDRLDELYINSIPEYTDGRHPPDHAFFHAIKCALNTLCSNLIYIGRTVDAIQPDRIILFQPSYHEIPFDYLLDPGKHFLFPRLIEIFTSVRSISLDVQASEKGTVSLLTPALISRQSLLRWILKIKAGVRTVKTQWRFSFQFRKSQSADDVRERLIPPLKICVKNLGASVGQFTRFMRLAKIGEVVDIDRVIGTGTTPSGEDRDGAFEKFWNEIQADGELNSLFTFEGIELFPVLREYLHFLFKSGLEQIEETTKGTAGFVSRNRPDAFLLPTITHFNSWAAAMVFRESGIPVVTWQHGSYAMFDPHTQPVHYDIKNADHFLVFGEGVRSSYFDEAKRWETEIKPVGSIDLDEIEIGKKSYGIAGRGDSEAAVKTVLIPLRCLDSGSHMPVIGDSYLTYPIAPYWHELKKMLLMFRDFSELRFILKLYSHNSLEDNPIIGFLQANDVKNVEVKDRPKFKSLLPKADLVIIDWPYTTLLESAKSGIPIICFKKNWELRDGVEELIERRCFITDDLNELSDLLDEFKRGTLPIRVGEDLLRLYGTHFGKGTCISRAVGSLVRIAESQRK